MPVGVRSPALATRVMSSGDTRSESERGGGGGGGGAGGLGDSRSSDDAPRTELRRRRRRRAPLPGSHSLSSFAILDAMFLKPILVPDIRLKRTPLSERRGSLHTSISHCTRESALGSPCTHNNKNLSRCS